MYYEISGTGAPLLLIPAAFSFAGLTEFPELTKCWRVIRVDRQGHGRTADLDRPLSLEQFARDVVALMRHLKIERAHMLGWSYGGLISMLIAMKNLYLVGRVVTYWTLFGRPGEGIRSEMMGAPHEPSPDGTTYAFAREQYKRVAPDPDHWPVIWEKVSALALEGLTRDQLASIKHRVLVAAGDNDFIRLEHAVDAYRALPNAELAVIPDASHSPL